LKLLFATLNFIFCLHVLYAQPGLPQRTITIQPTQDIDFGIFYVTSAGTITVDWQGNVSTTGGVVSFSSLTAHPAIFEIKLCQGRNVTVTYVPTTTLTGSNGGSFVLNVGPTEKGVSGSTFSVNNDCNFITTLRVGGTLEVPGSSPAGIYSGSFSMDFTQE
jgi:hypothetical protein